MQKMPTPQAQKSSSTTTSETGMTIFCHSGIASHVSANFSVGVSASSCGGGTPKAASSSLQAAPATRLATIIGPEPGTALQLTAASPTASVWSSTNAPVCWLSITQASSRLDAPAPAARGMRTVTFTPRSTTPVSNHTALEAALQRPPDTRSIRGIRASLWARLKPIEPWQSGLAAQARGSPVGKATARVAVAVGAASCIKRRANRRCALSAALAASSMPDIASSAGENTPDRSRVSPLPALNDAATSGASLRSAQLRALAASPGSCSRMI
mmetsp:Transcript_24293/g.61079  ORF Transcript_24293/g.61079 Transcript_24293/m.61079 type:complete len:271 (+) Transcript_24293:982-1794(+)